MNFTEADCDRLLNSEYVKTLLQNLTLDIDCQPGSFHIEQARCQLQPKGVVCLSANVVLNSQVKTKKAGFAIEFQFEQSTASIRFLGGKYLKNQSLDLDETIAILNKMRDLLYLRHFHSAGLTVDIVDIEITAGRLVLGLITQVKQLPDSINKSLESVTDKINSEN